MTAEQCINLGRKTALVSFIFGTVIFVLYYLTSWDNLLFFGYAYIVIAAIINIGIIILILVKAEKDKENSRRLIKTFSLLLLNIPVMFLYCWLSVILLDIMRVTFINATETTLSGIKIVGCGGGYIDKLEPGETETVWINITGDCSININYLFNGKRKEEIVAGYVTMSMGQKMKYYIGGQQIPF
jgi:hypothetical protein